MKSKKLLSIVSSALIATTLLVGCGDNTDDTDTNGNNAVTDTAEDAVDDATDTAEDAADDIVDGGNLEDGTYRAEQKDFDDKGWKAYAVITVSDGKITESEYDYLNADGAKKSEDADYEKNMKDKTGTGPAEYTKSLAQSLIDTQDPSKVETVTGATHSSDIFKDLAKKLVEAAKEGNTDTIVVENAAE